MSDQRNDDEIRTVPRPDCYLCGAQGKVLYEGLKDRLFGAPGEWNLKQCRNPECGLVWLDPMPTEEDIGKAYESYYTHHETGGDEERKGVKGFFKLNLRRAYNVFSLLTLLERERERRSLMYLEKITPGRLLEVGCGDGRRLALMHALGWEVEGQEVDPKAASHARSTYDFPVHLGALVDLAFPEATFDAIIMNHVIEHVHDPAGLLQECQRILKPGGTLVAITPNIKSYGHQYFGSCWRGWEPPRHVHLFSPVTLRACAERAGFHSIETWTTPINAPSIYLGSRDIQVSGEHKMGLKQQSLGRLAQAAWFAFWEFFLSRWQPRIGEEVVLKVVKRRLK